MKRVAVILCGSGYKDGSEIRESVGVLWALSQHQDTQVQCFAPDAPQADVINCLTGAVAPGETRNMRVEAARIARGDVKDLADFHGRDFDAIILPGGFGAAKNLCSFAREGSKGSVIPALQSALTEMNHAGKPIGAVCIAPAIVALAFKGRPMELTVGALGDAAREIEKLGHRHVVRAANDCAIDRANKVVSTPAYMYDDAPLNEIFEGIRKLVAAVLEMVG